MISKETLEYLKTLDHLRVRARTLRDQGLEAILEFDLNDDQQWEQQISDNEKVLFRRAKHLAWSLGQIEEHECEYGEHLFYPPETGKNRPYNRKVNYPAWPDIHLPLYTVKDLRKPVELFQRFKDAKAEDDPISRYIVEQFKGNRDRFNDYDGGEPKLGLLNCLVNMLNSVLTNPALYTRWKVSF